MMAVAATALVGTLGFLFVRSESVDFKGTARALDLLHRMKDLDARLGDAAFAAVTQLPAPDAVSVDAMMAARDRAALLASTLRDLEDAGSRRAVEAALPALRDAVAAKRRALDPLGAAHEASLAALRGLDAALAAAGADADAPDVRRARSTLRALPLEDFATALPGASVAALPGPVREAAAAFVRARAAEAAAWQRFAFLTTAERIQLTARTLSEALAHALDEQQRWRIYFFAYAAALLLALGYLAWRVAAAQAALRAANEGLEKRVALRTAELERTLAQLRESEAQLVQTEKMSSLGRMVAGIAHEINTPLAYVKNSLSVARSRLPQLREAHALASRLAGRPGAASAGLGNAADPRAALEACLAHLDDEHAFEDLDALTWDGLNGIEQIGELVANLRNFSRIDRSRVASFNVNDGVAASLLIARPMLRRIDVDKRLGEVPSITCAPSQVNQVVLNLITNAVQAIDKPRGRIRVETRRAGDAAVAIEVADDGRGIAPDLLPRIFDPFFTTKEPGKGTGLGLSIAYKIVAQHGGRIEVRSQPGAGATFTVTLPLHPPAEPGAGERQEAA